LKQTELGKGKYVPGHAIKLMGSDEIVPNSTNLVTTSVVIFMSHPHYAQGDEPRYPLHELRNGEKYTCTVERTPQE